MPRLLRRLADVLFRRPAPAQSERSTKSGELDVLERRVSRIQREAKGYERLTAELDGAVAAMRRRQ